MKIDLPVLDDKNQRCGVESLDAAQVGDRRFRLVYSPRLVQGMAAGDEIELDDGEHAGFRVVGRSGNLCVWMFFDKASDLRAPRTDTFQKEIVLLGGRLDGGMKRSLVFTIPVTVGFDVLQPVLAQFVEDVPGSTWMYGNVYDQNGDSLDWWM